MHEFFGSVAQRVGQGPNASNLAFFILLTAILLAPRLAGWAHMPSLVVFVLLGMIIGPHGLGWLKLHTNALKAFGEFGLLYLMFIAGLELDVRQLVQNKKYAITFAGLSFVIPFTLGVLSAHFLGYALAAAVLMGSNWGSHTLVTHPMLRKMGLTRIRSVSIVVGATMLTDTTALLVLSAISVSVRRTNSFVAEAAEILFGLSALGLWSLGALPKVARRVFARIGADPGRRLVFALVALFVGAILAESAAIDGIVGAFFAGLGLGRAIPEQSPLMDRVQFLGTSLLIPVFLISVGVLLDPHAMLQPKTLLYALIFTSVVLGGKATASAVVGRSIGLPWTEVGLMAGLSGSQAAATLATTLVGARLGLFDSLTINAVLVVVLTTLLITPAVVSICGRRVTVNVEAGARLGQKVVVPIWDASTRQLMPLAGRLAQADRGLVVGAAFAREDASDRELEAQRELRSEAEHWLAERGLEAEALTRLASSPVAGVINTLHAEGCTLIVCEWAPHGRRLDEDQDSERLLARSPVPHLLVGGTFGTGFDRVIVAADAAVCSPPDVGLALELGRRLVRKGKPQLVGLGRASDRKAFGLEDVLDDAQAATDADPIDWIRSNLLTSDLLLFPGLAAARAALSRGPQLLQRCFLVAVAGTTAAPRSA